VNGVLDPVHVIKYIDDETGFSFSFFIDGNSQRYRSTCEGAWPVERCWYAANQPTWEACCFTGHEFWLAQLVATVLQQGGGGMARQQLEVQRGKSRNGH